MSFYLTPGNALAIRVNAHRHGWDGSICNDPIAWQCLADPRFRERYCARGLSDCFHLAAFRLQEPSVVIEENGGAWVFEKDPNAFDDQLLFFWTQDFEEPRGVRDDRSADPVLIGAYRVRSVERLADGRFTRYRVRPFADSWTRFGRFRITAPNLRGVGGPYLKQMDRNHVHRVFQQLRDEAEAGDDRWYSPEDFSRFQAFDRELDAWLEHAHKATVRQAEQRAKRDASVASVTSAGHAPLAGIRGVVDRARDGGSGTVGSLGAAGSPGASGAKPRTAGASTLPPLVEPAMHARIREDHGEEVLTGLRLASLTRSLLVIRGNPGVGKSHLALRLLDDPQRERTLVIPVSSTWRGPEDLMGYLNPIDHRFEATPFVRFLIDAEVAWQKGDKRARVVVFEEFNLSQPEHWFADLLALTQFSDEKDRIWRAPGRFRDLPNKQDVFLSPAVRFVATVNTDHTTRPLSPRVLDRAAVLHLELDPRRALERVGLELEDAQLTAVMDLDAALRGRGVSFSVRSAQALHEAFEQRGDLGLDTWSVLDLVLEVELLGKVRLYARDPYDEAVRKELARFQEAYGRHLPRTADRLQGWEEALAAGRDVIQA